MHQGLKCWCFLATHPWTFLLPFSMRPEVRVFHVGGTIWRMLCLIPGKKSLLSMNSNLYLSSTHSHWVYSSVSRWRLPEAATGPGNLSETHIFKPPPRPQTTEWEAPAAPSSLCFGKPSQSFWCTRKFENHWSEEPSPFGRNSTKSCPIKVVADCHHHSSQRPRNRDHMIRDPAGRYQKELLGLGCEQN